MSECTETFRAFDMDQEVTCTEEGEHDLHMARDPVTAAMLVWGEAAEDVFEYKITGDFIDKEHENLIANLLHTFDEAGEYHDHHRHPDTEEGTRCQTERVSLISSLCLHIHAKDKDLEKVVQRTMEGRAPQKEAEDKEEGHTSVYEEAP